MRYLVIALLMYGCGPTPAFGDDFSTSDIRTMWQGCYQGGMRSNKGAIPVLLMEWCDCTIDKVRKEIGYKEYIRRDMEKDPLLMLDIRKFAEQCSPLPLIKPQEEV